MALRYEVDHNAVREWMVKKAASANEEERDLVRRALAVIKEAATEKQGRSLAMFLEEGMGMSAISRELGVHVSVVNHAIRRGLSNAYTGLVEILPAEALGYSYKKVKPKPSQEGGKELEKPLEEQEESPKEPEKTIWAKPAAPVQRKQPKKRALHMAEADIAAEYRRAKHKAQQIAILADMNLTSRAVIREVLREQGEDIPEPKKNHGRKAGTVPPLRIEEDVESCAIEAARMEKPEKTEVPQKEDRRGEEERQTVEKNEKKAKPDEGMSIEAIAEMAKNVKNTFPDVAIHMSEGVPSGALLSIHYDAHGRIAETVLLFLAGK